MIHPNPAAHAASLPVTAGPTAARRIVHRTRGQTHGPVTRLMSPGDLGETLKPFIFLDLFKIEPSVPTRFGLHPHSGIATLTALVAGKIEFSRPDGTPGSQAEGGIEWMMAGGGVWHGSPLTSPARAAGFQLWIALPPSLEEAPSEEIYLVRDEIPAVGPARVLMGDYCGVHHGIMPPSSMTYLHVVLQAGERWTFEPPTGHTVAWLAVDRGSLRLVDSTETKPVAAGELAVFEPGGGALAFEAVSDTSFVLGSAVPHPYPLVSGHYSVHTHPAALANGERRIAELGDRLRQAGHLR